MIITLGEACRFYSGTGFPEIYQGISNGEFPFFKVGDISANVSEGNIYLEKCANYISSEVVNSIHGTIIPPNTIVFAKIGEALKKNRRAITTQKSLVDNNAMGIAPIEDLLRIKYFYYFMCRLQMEKYAEATAVPSVRKSRLEQIEIDVPGLDEQIHIEKELDAISAIIAARQRQLRAYDTLIKARFVDIFGDMLINPMNWAEQKLETVAEIVSGITKGRKIHTTELYDVPYMAVSNVKDGYIDWTTIKTIAASRAEIEQYRLLPNDVLMTEGGDPDKLGRGAIIHNPPKDCIHQNHIFRVRLNQKRILPEFMEQYLQHQRAKRYFLGCAKQTTGIASINMTQLRALPILIPPMERQKQFVAFISQIDKSKVVVQAALDKAQLLFDSLMQQYFG